MSQSACPGSKLIASLLNGELSESQQASIGQHLDECADCREFFDSLANGPEYFGDISRLPDTLQTDAESAAVRRVLDQIEVIKTTHANDQVA